MIIKDEKKCSNKLKTLLVTNQIHCKNFISSLFPAIRKDDGTMTVSSEEKAEVFANQFALNSTLD